MTIFAETVLVPFSGIQFVTYSFDLNRVSGFKPRFIERPFPDERTEAGIPWKLLQGWNELDPSGDPPNVEKAEDDAYDVTKTGALEVFLGKWVPVPYLRRRPGRGQNGEIDYDKGPTNWVRVLVTRDDAPHDDDGLWYKAVFAFDTNLADDITAAEDSAEDSPQADHTQLYTAPRIMDAANPCEFCFVSSMSRIGWFLSDPQALAGREEMEDFQLWVAEWLEELFDESLKLKNRGRAVAEGDKRHRLEHAARWIALLHLLHKTVNPGNVRFVDTVSEGRSLRPVEVDLILDVGNNRTCGMLIENYPNEDTVELNNSLILQLRDIEHPWKTYDEPFESHVALSQAWFGKDNFSRMSGRERAFFWPTMVRVGPEASRLKARRSGTESIVGMSSPKRYLWDVAQVNQPWRFPQSDYTSDGELPPIGRLARRYLNANGDVLSQLRKDKDLFAALYPKSRAADYSRPSQQLTYSRSSFYALMLTEVFFQAMVMINDPAVRAERRQSEAPRRLRRIVLTLPSALPIREQQIMKSRAESAIAFIWDIMQWTANPPPGLTRPSVLVSWDEASCVQLVWLYGEINRRFGGRIREYFEMVGKPRKRFTSNEPPAPDAVLEPSLRVASLDIGGGTTDLMITTYFQDEDRAIVPVQTFREGVRIAGDDITRSVIERCIIPAIERALVEHGVRDVRVLLRDLFNGDRANMAEQQKHSRRQFVLRVLVPAALGLMSRYEESGPDRYETVGSATLAQLIRNAETIPETVLRYVYGAFEKQVPAGLDLLSVPVPLDFRLLANAINETMDVVLDPMSEALAHFDCDYVLLSGRPTKLAAITEGLIDRLFIGPDRLLPMGQYRAGNWYPFRSKDNLSIGDPKSCAVVGGVLCSLAERSIVNFLVYTHLLQARSTTRYLGALELDGKLRDDNVLFTFDGIESGNPADSGKTFPVYTEAMIGYRQLPYERWITSPLYHLKLDDSRPPRPIRVTLVRDQVSELEDDESPDERARRLLIHEGTKEDIRIAEAIDNNGADVQRSVSISFRTFPLSVGDYWLDSGILMI